MVRLSVNVNKIATLRNARGGNHPDVLAVALDCERFGAQGITVHPRPDERHIRYSDVLALGKIVQTELNIEGYPDRRFIDLVSDVRPTQATLVPDPPNALTSTAGWDTLAHQGFLRETVKSLHALGVRVSIFIAADEQMVAGAKATGADRIELYTGPYAHEYGSNPEQAVIPYIKAAAAAHGAGLEVNAGHDLNLKNLGFFIRRVHSLAEVSIGHALVCDALYLGLQNTIQLYLHQLDPATGATTQQTQSVSTRN